jgi:protein PhnA
MQERCPKCQSENIYQDGNLWMCPECANEWVEGKEAAATEDVVEDTTVRDANGNILADGDAIVVVKDLKVKGSSTIVKSGTKARNIRLISDGAGHNMVCKFEGLGAINIKSELVKKV